MADGQDVLELGCGWGSLTLWVAERYPASRITAISNSHSQRAWILGAAERRGLGNVQILTADMNVFDIGGRFDRVVSLALSAGEDPGWVAQVCGTSEQMIFRHYRTWMPKLRRGHGQLLVSSLTTGPKIGPEIGPKGGCSGA